MASERKPKTDSAKYDRQLRLWGEDGQSRLEATHIALLHATATGTETLKNLVLPGVGRFTVIDPGYVDETDLGNNFFLDESHLGLARASVACDNLRELNDLVDGEWMVKDPVELVEKSIESFSAFTLVVATNMPELPLRTLAKYCWDKRIPLVIPRSYGFIGHLRVVVPEHTVIESKPDDPQSDLRIANPWPELEQYAALLDFEAMDSKEHSHVAYPLILIKYMLKWKKEHNGSPPSTSAEKNEFKSQVIRGSRKANEENFDEAHRAAHRAWTPYRIPPGTEAVLSHPQIANLTADSSNFWILAAALKEFVSSDGRGFLPLPGSIPDMASTTEGYLSLQTLYQAKANQDVDLVHARVKAILARLGKPIDSISHDEVKHFCKNSNFLQVINYRPLEDEFSPATANTSVIASNLADPSHNVKFHVVLRACDRFHRHHGRYPGSSNVPVRRPDSSTGRAQSPLFAAVDSVLMDLGMDDVSMDSSTPSQAWREDEAPLREALAEVSRESGLSADVAIDDDAIADMLRYGAAEVHATAALMGGVASQEIIKLITHQYTPINNTFIFNGVPSTSNTLEL